MNGIEKLYNRSPIFLQNIMISISGYLRNRTRYGKSYYKHRKFLLQFDAWSYERKLEFQRMELRKLLKYAINRSGFYRNLYSGIDIERICDIEDLKKLPPVDKELLRQNINQARTIPKRAAVEGHTGGTTGKSLVVFFTPEDMMKRMAMLDHFKGKAGFQHLKMRRATFNGKHIIPGRQRKKIFWRYNKACRQMIYSSFHMTKENLGYYVEGLNRFKPQALDGFCSSLCELAKYIERKKCSLTFIPIAIFPTSETVSEEDHCLLERVFQCKVYNQYSSSEGAPFITECSEQNLHVEMASGIFENYDEENDEVLVTSFTSYGTPLIRYRIGDCVRFADNKKRCSCGMESIMAEEVRGRNSDFLYTAKGARIYGGNIANLFKNIPNAVIKAQLIQERKEKIQILLEVDQDQYNSEYDRLLKEEFCYKFGDDTEIVIQHVNEIYKEANGKFKMIHNNVRDDNELSKEIRILQVFASLDCGGAETLILNLYKQMERDRMQFDFIANERKTAYAYEEEIKSLGGRIFFVPRFTVLHLPRYIGAWRRILKAHTEWKIIHVHHTIGALIYLFMAKKYKRIIIAHSHTSAWDHSPKGICKFFLRLPLRYLADYLFACSKLSADWMFGKNYSDVYLLKNAIEASKYIFREKIRSDKRKELGLYEEFIIGHIGNFSTAKNYPFIVDIFQEVYRKNRNVKLLLIGKKENASKNIRQALAKLPEQAVIFTGVRKDIGQLLQAMDLFVFPSLFEGLPASLIEAQASGLKCIVSDRITKETDITGLLEFIPLDETPEYWSSRILRYAGGYERKNCYDDICRAGYDAKTTAVWLQSFYRSVADKWE